VEYAAAGNEDKAAERFAVDLALLTALHEAGITLVLGTDAGSGKLGVIAGSQQPAGPRPDLP